MINNFDLDILYWVSQDSLDLNAPVLNKLNYPDSLIEWTKKFEISFDHTLGPCGGTIDANGDILVFFAFQVPELGLLAHFEQNDGSLYSPS